ncbi:MAG: hypothetical protein WDA16_01485 [Candidatus Thermoplasmatota archaeon]
MRPVLVLFVLAALVAAGCVSPEAKLDPRSVKLDTAAVQANLSELVAGVPCDAKSVSAGKTSENLKQITNIAYEGEGIRGEIDARGDWLLTARYADGGFEVTNIADPANPVRVGAYLTKVLHAYDVKWMPDNETAIVGHTDTVDLVDVGPVIHAASLDIIEKENITPILLDVWKYPSPGPGHTSTNMHMLTTGRINGVDYVFLAPNDDAGVMVAKLVGEGSERKLQTIGRLGDDVLPGGPLGPHDMSLVWDEFTHKPVLYVANGVEGWKAFDVSDPAKATMLAISPNIGPAQGYTHTAIGQKVGDRRLVATIQEVGVNTLSIFDATDWRTPILLAQWQSDRTDPTTPEHNIQLLDGKLYVAHYTKGVFIFDLKKLDSKPLVGTLGLAPMAHYQPTKPTSAPPPSPVAFADVWDVVVHRGVVYVNDVDSGTDVVAFGCLTAGDSTLSSVN